MVGALGETIPTPSPGTHGSFWRGGCQLAIWQTPRARVGWRAAQTRQGRQAFTCLKSVSRSGLIGVGTARSASSPWPSWPVVGFGAFSGAGVEFLGSARQGQAGGELLTVQAPPKSEGLCGTRQQAAR